MMSTLRRTAIAGIGLATSLVLAGCAGDSGDGTGSEGAGNQGPSQAPTPQASGGPQISNPKDATVGDPCALLTPEAASAVGVKPKGEVDAESMIDAAAKACEWESQDGSKFIAFTPIRDRSIQNYYDNADSFVEFKKLTIAGYPAVRANKSDPMKGGSCDIFLATGQKQVVQATSGLPSEQIGKVDPCVTSKKALKMSVSSWPAAK